ncbi:hypothetical protein [Bosea sp. (in: a-proteobacteria)]|uniref:hypothetical protein n=1 Tax=Bosea sp. (in: a-proteobacteria) TaxID=1871050 RepID=UPI00333E1F59
MHSGVTAVLDIGKTNSKVLAFDAGLDLVATYDTASISDGTHLDTAHGWAFILASLKEIAKRFRLSAIVPATHGAAFAVMGENGLAHPVVDYEKPVPAAASADYDRLRPDFAESFSPGLPRGLNAGRQLFALDRFAPGLLRPAGCGAMAWRAISASGPWSRPSFSSLSPGSCCCRSPISSALASRQGRRPAASSRTTSLSSRSASTTRRC